MLASGGMGGGANPPSDTPQVDTAEQIYVSSLALIKMLKHGASMDCSGSVMSSPEITILFRASWSAHGGDGLDARRVCG